MVALYPRLASTVKTPPVSGHWADEAACISDIFSHQDRFGFTSEATGCYLTVFPNYVKLKTSRQAQPPGGERGPITGFSHGARLRMIQRMASLAEYPDFWIDLTFADDVMEGKGIVGRRDHANRTMKKFKRKVERLFPELRGLWRREWEPRKSGRLVGEECPHYHTLLSCKGYTERNFSVLCFLLAQIWVDCTGTIETAKALSVAVNPRSYRWLVDKKMAQVYVSKYVAKVEDHSDDEEPCSRGRYWGKIGDLQVVEGVHVRLAKEEEVLLRRLFRSKVGSKVKRLFRIFAAQNRSGWLLITAGTVRRMLQWVKDEADVPISGPLSWDPPF